MAQGGKRERAVLAIVGSILVWGGFGVSALLAVVAVVLTVQGSPVAWPALLILIAVAALVGLLGLWIVRRSNVPLGDALNL
ncbi:hypothetical protein [Microlunatus parietis]|uniref:Uncharacterized protein n=1 Tax=Microlunatus parietis TaxID=682979 RepID=A0A7Y9LBU5_9ACTN|nr:hypothetical protein [Microlunatus parietis]NYE71203.1 hypothetical protein [Microlunatus parietis]